VHDEIGPAVVGELDGCEVVVLRDRGGYITLVLAVFICLVSLTHFSASVALG
jgi:hypothetical protein